jgi:nucleoside-diphosphate-sugar epimerase
MTVLVTGAAGFLGRAIVRAFTREGISVLATDTAEAGFDTRPGTRSELVAYDRRDLEQESLEDLVSQVSGVVYAAALTPRDETADGVAERLLAVNLKAFIDLIISIRGADACRRVLFVSSSSIYDQTMATTLCEDDVSPTGGVYGAAKLAAETVGRRYLEVIGREFCAVRPTTLIGPGERWRPSRPHVSTFAQLMAAARAGQPVHLESGHAREDVLSVDDAADAVTALWRQPVWDGSSFSVSAGALCSLADLAEAVAGEVGLSVTTSGTVIDGGSDLPALVSHRRLTEATGWTPRRTLGLIVRECVEEGEP